MKKLIIFGPGDWAEAHIASLITAGILKEGETVNIPSDTDEVWYQQLARGWLQVVVFTATPTGRWDSAQLQSLWRRVGDLNPRAVVAFAPPRTAQLSREDVVCRNWKVLDQHQPERGEDDSLYELVCSVLDDD